MTQEKLIDAITDLDSDILNRYFDMKADLAAKKKPKKRTWVKWASLAAACMVLVVMATFAMQYIPTEYNLNYSYVDANGTTVRLDIRVGDNINLVGPDGRITSYQYFSGKTIKSLKAIVSYYDYNTDDNSNGYIQMMLTSFDDVVLE